MNNANRTDRLSELADRPINEDLSFGIDVGVASCGWAVVDVKNQRIVKTGVRAFEEAETAASRRMARGMRRNLQRKAQRLRQLRKLMRNHRIHPDPSPDTLRARRGRDLDPVRFSVKGLHRKLDASEAASVLLYWAGHRGFQSNSKRDRKDKDNRKLLKALSDNEKRLDGRTFSEFVLEQYDGRRRNRKDEFLLTPKRDWLREEATKVIGVQRRLGALWATTQFEEEYLNIAFDQRPLRSSAHLIGYCKFEPKHRRASRFSYSYEKFRLLQALQDRCAIRNPDGSSGFLTSSELRSAIANIGSHRGFTYARLRSTLGLDRRYQFIEAEDESIDIVSRGTTGRTAGCYTVRKLVGEAMWRHLTSTPELLDRAVAMISYGEGIDEIRSALSSLGIGRDTVAKLMEGVESGVFDDFSGPGNISSKAARKLIPLMLNGLNYADACEAVGYDHAKSPEHDPDINSPAVKRALNEAKKQVAVLIRKYGRPGHISVEMTRGKIMSSAQKELYNLKTATRRKYREVCEAEWKTETGRDHASRGDIENYMLWKEQCAKCIFCDAPISMKFLQDNLFELEHILPKSISYDNSQSNRVLACTKCNREKLGRTPYQWFGDDEDRWSQFKARAGNPNIDAIKRRKLLTENLADPQDFVNRQLVDTSTVARRLMADIKKLYPEMYSSGQRIAGVSGHDRVSAIPGRITGMLRSSWMRPTGYQKDRQDDRHHALDAMVLATITSHRLPKMLKAVYREAEVQAHIRQRRTPEFPPPWPMFAEECVAILNSGWLVCRTEDRRVRGALHEGTYRTRRRTPDGNWDYVEWKSVGAIKDGDVTKIPDDAVRSAVKKWHAVPKDERPIGPTLPNGTVAKRVRIRSGKKTARQINPSQMGGKRTDSQGGFVENSESVRLDVYHVTERKPDAAFQKTLTPGHYIVPVYPHNLDAGDGIPVLAAIGGKPETDWPEMHSEDFKFSLFKDSFVEIARTKNGQQQAVRGYYRGPNRFTASITVSPHNSRRKESQEEGIGVRRLVLFRKFHVDRLGNLHEIKREPWPGTKHE